MSKGDRFKRLADGRDAENSNPQKSQVIEQIVGDYEQTSSVENMNTVHEQTAASSVSNRVPEKVTESMNSNTDNEQLNVTVSLNSDTEQYDVISQPAQSNEKRVPHPIKEFEKRIKKPTIEETHTRGTYLIRNDLLKRLNKLAKHQHRGFKTHLVNYALERILDELENS